MNWERQADKIYPITTLIDNRLMNASEFIDPESDQRIIVVERGQYDSENRVYELLKQYNMPLFERQFDQDTVTYFVPPGTETIKSFMPKFLQNLDLESESNMDSGIYIPFFELGKLLGYMSARGVRFRSGENILEKIAISPDTEGRFGLQNYLIPPLNFTFGKESILDFAQILNEIKSLRLKKKQYEYLVESMGEGFVSQYGQISA
jgi:hypothetical protein